MAVAFRPVRSFSQSSALVLATRLAWGVSAVAPVLATGPHLARAKDPNVVFDSSTGTTVVYSSVTGQPIPQGTATDGSGSGFSTSAVLWILFSFVVGGPLLIAGSRGSRLTLGAAVGMAAALASWAVIVNTLDDVGVSDIVLTICILLLFILGFCLGYLEMTRVVAILDLGLLGGVAIGIRIILLRSGLLISGPDLYFLNWLIIGACGIAVGILAVLNPTWGILIGCASTGSFLCGLGFDLVINQQSGMSRGLRFLFDRNSYHVLDTTTNRYSPSMTTVIILAVSLGVTPAFALAQWRVFVRPSSGAGHDASGGSVWDSQDAFLDEESMPVPQRSIGMSDAPTTEKPHELSFDPDTKEGQSR